jgi:hypothetical protein
MQGNLMITKIKDLQNVAVPTMDIMVETPVLKNLEHVYRILLTIG